MNSEAGAGAVQYGSNHGSPTDRTRLLCEGCYTLSPHFSPSSLEIDTKHFPFVNKVTVPVSPQRRKSKSSWCKLRRRTWQKLAIFVVAFNLFLDLALMTALVPIAPLYLGLEESSAHGYIKLGVLLGSNAGVQILTNIILGTIIDRHGAVIPLFFGLVAMTISTTTFAFAGDISWDHRYAILLGARLMQGISSACAATAGMAWLAGLCKTDEERGQAMGTAMSGMGLGVLVGPPLGSSFTFLGTKSGWRYPFLILAFLALCDGALQFSLWYTSQSQDDDDESSAHCELENEGIQSCHAEGDEESEKDNKWYQTIVRLSSDPYVVFLFVISFLGNGVIATLEASLPSMVLSTFHPSHWILGALFLPCMLPYVIITPLSGKYFARLGRHFGLLISLILTSIGICVIALGTPYLVGHSVWYLSIPLMFCGAGLGILDSTVMPYMADIIQKRHSNLFGSSCAIVDTSVSMAFFLGPLISNSLIDLLKYEWVYLGLGAISLLLAPFSLLLQHDHTTRKLSR